MADQQPFVLDCPDCDVRHDTDRIDEALEFAAKHEEHTGHRPDWARHEFGYDPDATHTVHAVSCPVCHETWEFADPDRADAWADEHATYTDHDPAEPESVERSSLAADAEDVIDVVSALDPATPATHGVPIGMVLAECVGTGTDVADAAAAIEDGLESGELYAPQAGEVTVVEG